jgi:hypothetical protein
MFAEGFDGMRSKGCLQLETLIMAILVSIWFIMLRSKLHKNCEISQISMQFTLKAKA